MNCPRLSCFFLYSATIFAQSNVTPAILSHSLLNKGSANYSAFRKPTTPQTSGLNFATAVTYDSGGLDANSVAVADLNGDGKPDLVVANGNGTTVGVLLGNGDGTFQSVLNYAAGSAPRAVAVGDFNRDGKLDLAAADVIGGAVSVLMGNGDGTFQSAVTYDSGGVIAISVAVADTNGDGKPDLVVADECVSLNCGEDGSVGVLLGNGDGTFQAVVTYDSGGSLATSVTAADVNGDGKPDLVVTNCGISSRCTGDGSVGVLLGNGDGTFQPAVTYDSGGDEAFAVAVADVNGDGKLDLLVANDCTSGSGCSSNSTMGTAAVLLGNGDGTFQTATTYSTGGNNAEFVAVADVNGDGKLDVMVPNLNCASSQCDSNGTVGVLLGNGDSTFQAAVTYSSGGYFDFSIAVADVNGDGKPDLLVTNCGSSGSSGGACVGDGLVGVLINTSTGSTTTALTSSPNPSGFNRTVTFTATVTAQPIFSKTTATGTVTFAYGSTTLCTAVPLIGGTATCVYSTLPAGADAVTAAYSGDANFAPSSGTITQTVNKVATTTTFTSTPNPSNFNQQITFTATPAGQFGGTPTGTVTFSDGTTILGTSPLSSGTATFSIGSLAPGLHSISAVYSGDSNFLNSSGSLNQTVNQASTTVIVTSSVNPSGFGFPVTFLAAITPQYGGQTTGTVTFKDGLTTLGSTAVSGNVASLTTKALGIGTHSITTLYSGDSNFTSSTSSVLSQIVEGPTLTISPSSLTFQTQVVFTNSKSQAVTLTNAGQGILLIKGGGVTGPFGITTTCGGTVNPGASCTINVTFKPQTIGPLTGSVSVRDNASGSPQKITLSGTGTYIQLSPTSMNFGNQPVGTKSLQKKITVSNKGSVAVSVSGISITGTNPNDFAQVNNCGTSIAAGASCFIGVTFTPSTKGSRSASVSISDNGGGSPQQVQLAGSGT